MTNKHIYLAGGCFWGTEHFFKQIANFCAHCARQLRTQKSVAQQLYVYAHTSPFRTDVEQHYLSELVTLPVATANNSASLIR